MFISHDHKIIFIHVHRTGGATLMTLLKEYLPGGIDTISQHGNARSIECEWLKKHSDYVVFGFVRNPWDRFLSWYSLVFRTDKMPVEKERQRLELILEKDFLKINQDNYFHYNQLDYFTDEVGHNYVDQIYRFENFNAEVKKIFELFNVPLETIPIKNNTTQKDYREFYTEKSRALITELCQQDIEHFEYSF